MNSIPQFNVQGVGISALALAQTRDLVLAVRDAGRALSLRPFLWW